MDFFKIPEGMSWADVVEEDEAIMKSKRVNPSVAWSAVVRSQVHPTKSWNVVITPKKESFAPKKNSAWDSPLTKSVCKLEKSKKVQVPNAWKKPLEVAKKPPCTLPKAWYPKPPEYWLKMRKSIRVGVPLPPQIYYDQGNQYGWFDWCAVNGI